MTRLTARQEWATMWPLPLVAMLGACGSAIFAYSSGIFMVTMTRQFGWSRAAFSTAFALQMVAGLLILPISGWLVDRFGPRKVALFGIPPFVAALSLLGLADSSVIHWWLLCLVLAATQGAVAQTVWIKAVASRFETSRGLAMSITLAGLGLATLIWPILTAFYIGQVGWRLAFPALAFTWAVIVFPLVYLFFHGSTATAHEGFPPPAKASYGSALRTRTFICLLIAASVFSSTYYGLIIHLVPILQGSGLGLKTAAIVAGLAGAASVTGRVITGHLLDRLSVRAIAIVVFAMPLPVVTLLFYGHGSLPVSIVAVIFLGLASGAELDIIAFIAATRFGREVFGSVYAVFTAVISVAASTGPIMAGAVFDHSHSYTPFFGIVAVLTLVSSGLILLIPRKPERLAPISGPKRLREPARPAENR